MGRKLDRFATNYQKIIQHLKESKARPFHEQTIFYYIQQDESSHSDVETSDVDIDDADDDVGGVKNEVKGEDDDIDDDDDIEEDDDDIDERRYLHLDKEAKPDLFQFYFCPFLNTMTNVASKKIDYKLKKSASDSNPGPQCI